MRQDFVFAMIDEAPRANRHPVASIAFGEFVSDLGEPNHVIFEELMDGNDQLPEAGNATDDGQKQSQPQPRRHRKAVR